MFGRHQKEGSHADSVGGSRHQHGKQGKGRFADLSEDMFKESDDLFAGAKGDLKGDRAAKEQQGRLDIMRRQFEEQRRTGNTISNRIAVSAGGNNFPDF